MEYVCWHWQPARYRAGHLTTCASLSSTGKHGKRLLLTICRHLGCKMRKAFPVRGKVCFSKPSFGARNLCVLSLGQHTADHQRVPVKASRRILYYRRDLLALLLHVCRPRHVCWLLWRVTSQSHHCIRRARPRALNRQMQRAGDEPGLRAVRGAGRRPVHGL